MKINPYIFRGYDIRGVVGVDLSTEFAEHLGRAYGTYLARRGIREFVVGRDCRASGEAYSRALIKGLIYAGADVVDIGMNLVGTFYWSQYFLKRKGGVYISASHNPSEYNGFKLANDFSVTLVYEEVQELRRMIEEEDYAQKEGGRVASQNILVDYYNDILGRFSITKKFRIVIDPSCTTAGAIVPELLRKFGLEVIEKNCTVDSNFPLGIADPTSSTVLERLAKEVVEVRADLGFSYDADGDRIGVVDAKGNIVWNDVLLELFILDVLNRHKGATIMYNTLCSIAVKETTLKAGGKPFLWRVGYSFLKKKNQEVGAAFIGELSGHFFFSKDFYNHDDGIYSTMRLLSYLAGTGRTLSEEVAALPSYISSPEIKIFCPDDKKLNIINKMSAILKDKFPHSDVIDDERMGDGVRMEFPDKMLVARYSQNGPYLTIKFEARKEEDYRELKNLLSDLLHKFKEIDWNSPINLNINTLKD